MKTLKLLGLQSQGNDELYSRYAVIGEVYFREELYDSAWLFLDSVFCSSSNTALRKQSAELLAKICITQGKDAELINYTSFLLPYANQEENKSEIKSELTELYNSYCQANLKHGHRQENRKRAFHYSMLIVVLLVVLLTVAFLYRNSKCRERRLKIQQAALSGRLKCSNQKVRDMEQVYNRKKDDIVWSSTIKPIAYEEEPICRIILDKVKEGHFKAQMDCSLYESYALDRNQLLNLRVVTNRHFNNFTKRLKSQYPRLTEADFDYCCLFLLGLTNADISALMQRAYNTVNERINKLKMVFGTEDPLPQFLSAFAFEHIKD